MADNRISSSKREIYSKFFDVMEKYDKDIENDDYAKTGLVGWLFEINAMMLRDSTYHKSAIYNEHFLNTAQIPQSIYNYAKMYNVEIDKATPAYADTNIFVSLPELLNLTASGESIILNKEDQILAGDYEFALEHSIVITNNNGVFSATLQPPSAEYTSTTYQSLTNYTLSVRQDGSNLIIPVRLFQYKINKYNTQIVSSTFLNKKQSFKFDNQFCGAKLFYVKNGKKINVPLVYSELDTTESNYALYNLKDEHELEIIFKEGDNYFTPAPNSNIVVYIYTTRGEDVPKSFSGDALMQISNTDLKTLPVVVQFNPTDIIGGINTASLDKLKQKIINEISISHTIVTQADLDDYFNKIITIINEINDGRIKFIKRRDDIIRRIFDSYLLVRDRTDDSLQSTAIKSDNKYISPCVPTNSINVIIDTVDSSLETGISTLNNCKFTLDSIDAQDSLYKQSNEENLTDYYVCPFSIYIYDDKFTFAKYIYNVTDSTSEIKTRYNDTNTTTTFNVNNNSYYMTPVNAELIREFSSENSFKADENYNLYLKFMTNFPVNDATVENSLNVNNDAFINIRGLTSIGSFEIVGAVSEKVSDNLYNTTFQIQLPVNDNEFKAAEQYDFNRIQIDTKDNNTIAFLDTEKLIFQINLTDIFDITLGENSSKYPDIEVINPLRFFSSLDNIMSSELSRVDGGYRIEKLPVVHSSFFEDAAGANSNLAEKKKGFMQQLFTYINKLQESSELLETSTNFNLKFYNTYGPSFLYNTNRTNLKIDMEIVLNSEYKDNDKLKQEMRSYIRRLVDVMNVNLGYIDIYKIISILYDTEIYGNYINNISYAAGSESLRATIEKLDLPEGTTENDIVPEWLNLDYQYLVDEENGGIKFK